MDRFNLRDKPQNVHNFSLKILTHTTLTLLLHMTVNN